jgi:hypothetical protein
MAKNPPKPSGGENITPPSLPKTEPPNYAQPGHDFTLQAVMEMRESVGRLNANVERLIADTKSQGDKIDGLRHQSTFIKGGMAASVFFLTVIVGVASFILNAKWEALLLALKTISKQ